MPSMSSIIYDTKRKKYAVVMVDSEGWSIISNTWFETYNDAEEFLDDQLRKIGAEHGEEIPVKRQ